MKRDPAKEAAYRLAANMLRKAVRRLGQDIEAGLLVDPAQRAALGELVAELDRRANPEGTGDLFAERGEP